MQNNIPFRNEPFINPQMNYQVGYQQNYNNIIVVREEREESENCCVICCRGCEICIGVAFALGCIIFIIFILIIGNEMNKNYDKD